MDVVYLVSLGLLDSVVRITERMRESELCFFWDQKEGQCFVFAL